MNLQEATIKALQKEIKVEARNLSKEEQGNLICNRNELHKQLVELQADFEDFTDAELIESRQVMLDRVNECLKLILETDEDNI